MKTELESRIVSTEEKLKSCEINLAKKTEENESIRKECEEKIKTNEKKLIDLESRNQTLESQMLDSVRFPKLLKEVRSILIHKGFISEKEFEDIMRKK
ncbi:MAG: hypothetical protein ACFE9Z_03740 [Promethearchaeota archaeon]